MDDKNTKESTDGLAIRQKIIDMEIYALGLIGGWSVKDQKLLGDYIAALMHRMVEDATELQYSWNKKAPLKSLDMHNHSLDALVQIASDAGCLRGAKNYAEWSRRISEIGRMIGGYYKYIYPDKQKDK